jgi:hypothetical protein
LGFYNQSTNVVTKKSQAHQYLGFERFFLQKVRVSARELLRMSTNVNNRCKVVEKGSAVEVEAGVCDSDDQWWP